MSQDNPQRYLSFGRYLKDFFGEKVMKVSVDAGFTCPNRDGSKARGGCIYCDNTAFVPAGSGSVSEQVREGIVRTGRGGKIRKFIAYFQAHTNTYAPVDKLEALFRQALSVDGVVGLSVGTRPDCVSDEILDMLARLDDETHLWVEYGLQSASDATLERINRGHTRADFVDAVERTRKRGIRTCAHVILGLPGETLENMRDTVGLVANLGMEGIKFHHLHVIRGTALEEMYGKNEVRVLGFDEYSDILVEMLEILPPETVVQRLFGWAPPDLLVAPDWGMNRQQIHAAIDRKMEKRKAKQGKKHETG